MTKTPRQKRSQALTRKSIRGVLLAAALISLFISLAFAVTHTTTGTRLWQKQTRRTFTTVELLPLASWGFGTKPMMITRFIGAPLKGGTETKYGFLVVERYDLRVWTFDPDMNDVLYFEPGSA